MSYITNFEWNEQKLLSKCETDCVLIARPKEYNFARTTSGLVQMYFEPLTDEPKPILDCDYDSFIRAHYIAIDTHQDLEYLPHAYDFDDYEINRAEECERYFRNKLVVFEPIYDIKKDGRSFKNMHIIGIVEDTLGAWYYAIPNVDLDNKRFEKSLEKSSCYRSCKKYENYFIDQSLYMNH